MKSIEPAEPPDNDSLSWSEDLDRHANQDLQDVEEISSIPSFFLPKFLAHILRKFRRGKPAALKSWLSYYNGLFLDRGPDPDLYANLLAMNGCWNAPSPFVPGSLNSSSFCSSGIFLAEVVYLLDRWVSHVMEGGNQFFETVPANLLAGEDVKNPYINPDAEPYTFSSRRRPGEPSSVFYHQAMHQRSNHVMDLEYARGASACLVELFLDKPIHWSWMSNDLHLENRLLLCRIIYEFSNVLQRPHLLRSWVSADWLTSSAADRLANSFISSPKELS